MNKRVVEYNTIYQWTWEKSVYLVIGRPTSVQALEPAEPVNSKPAQIPLTIFRKKQIPHSQERIRRSPSFLRGDSSIALGRKKVPHTKDIPHGIDLTGCRYFSFRVKGEQWVSGCPSCVSSGWWNILSRSTQSTELRLRGGRILGNRYIRISKGIKGIELSRSSTHGPLRIPCPGISLLDLQPPQHPDC